MLIYDENGGVMRRRYDEAFKKEAVRLVKEEGLTQAQVTLDLGLGYGTIKSWLQADAKNQNPEALEAESQEQELKRLRKEVHLLKMERDLLKKAAAYFAKDS